MKRQHSLRQTLQLIADILSFENSSEDLENVLKNHNVDWEAVVSIASNHLMLPAVYCRLKQKKLLQHLPKDLEDYLKELAELNRERNKVLLKESKEISNLFNEHQIEHVFLKGIALMAGNYYEDIAERMIGDIDILVHARHLEKAFELLASQGYSNFVNFNYEVKNYRHFPRQISENHLGAVELHNHILKHDYKQLVDINAFFMSKALMNNLTIPGRNHIIWHTILAHQINDNNSFLGSISLKAVYDILVLQLDQKGHLMTSLSQQRYAAQFLSLSSVFFPSLSLLNQNMRTLIYKHFFLFTLKYPKFGRVFHRFKLALLYMKERIELLFENKSYRKHILKKMKFN